MEKKFDKLNETFNTSNELVQPEVVEEKIEKVKSSVDDIAFRVAKDFNAVQKNGKDLKGKIGNDMFVLGLPVVEKI